MESEPFASVFFFHLEWSAFGWGYLGVDVFFTLSGFLITSLLVSELYQTNSISLNDFWARRIRRLMPGAVLLVIFVAWTIASRNCFVDLLFDEGTQCSQSVYYNPSELFIFRWDALGTIWQIANWELLWRGSSYFAGLVESPVLHTWSLAVEEQFYWVWPLFLALLSQVLNRVSFSIERFMNTLTCLACIASIVSAWLFADLSSYYNSFGRAHEILFGAFSALVFRQQILLETHSEIALDSYSRKLFFVWFGAWLLLLVGHILWTSKQCDSSVDPLCWYYNGGSSVVAMFFAGLFAALSRPKRMPRFLQLIANFFNFPPLPFMGKLSYGVYLWHWPFIFFYQPTTVWAGLAVLLVSNLVACFTYYMIELPIQNLGKGSAGAFTFFGALMSMLSLTALICLATTGAMQGGEFQVPTFAPTGTYYLQSIHADVLQLADFLEHLESRMVATPDAAAQMERFDFRERQSLSVLIVGDSWAIPRNAKSEWDRFLTRMRQQHGDFTVRRCFAGCSGDAFFRRWNSATNNFLPGIRELDSASLGNVVHETSTCPSEMTNECAAALGPADIVIHVEHWEWVNAGVFALAEDCILDLDPDIVKPGAPWYFFTVPASGDSNPSEPFRKSSTMAVRSVEEQNALLRLHLPALAEAVRHVHPIYLIDMFAIVCGAPSIPSGPCDSTRYGYEHMLTHTHVLGEAGSYIWSRAFYLIALQEGLSTRGILYPGPLDKPYGDLTLSEEDVQRLLISF